MNKSCWYYVTKFINEHKNGEILNATSMLHYVRDHKPEYTRKYYYLGKENGIDSLPDVLYWYRVTLKRSGFLQQIDRKGTWLKIKYIPKDMSSYKVQRDAYKGKRFTSLRHLRERIEC